MSLGQELAPHLPFLRRYARALTGSQAHGDAFVRATLEAIVAKPDEFPRDVDPRKLVRLGDDRFERCPNERVSVRLTPGQSARITTQEW